MKLHIPTRPSPRLLQVVYHDLLHVVQSAVPSARLVGLDELLARSDYVSVHCELSDATRHLLGAAGRGRRAAILHDGHAALSFVGVLHTK